jgi:hypothetical protein
MATVNGSIVYFTCMHCHKTESRTITIVEMAHNRYELPKNWTSFFSIGNYLDFCSEENCQIVFNHLVKDTFKGETNVN